MTCIASSCSSLSSQAARGPSKLTAAAVLSRRGSASHCVCGHRSCGHCVRSRLLASPSSALERVCGRQFRAPVNNFVLSDRVICVPGTLRWRASCASKSGAVAFVRSQGFVASLGPHSRRRVTPARESPYAGTGCTCASTSLLGGVPCQVPVTGNSCYVSIIVTRL